MTLAYKGTAYHGFQVQKNALSVAEVFQDAVQATFGVRYDVKGCSRTDTGVHARRFVLTLAVDSPADASAFPCANILRALNAALPPDIAVLDCAEAPPGFHPRYSATGKKYCYRIWNAPVRNPFEQEFCWHLPRPLDVNAMNAAAQLLVGKHDFSAFCAAGGKVSDHLRTLRRCTVERQGDLVTITVEGDGFLYNMVRSIAGTLTDVAYGKLSPENIPAVLQSLERSRAGATAPAQGLCLEEVYY
ncbi:MAG: tRNA pseudouridine(38-40) synthase TruA [Angelakisella sp.]